MPSGDIISTHAVHSEMDCSFKCFRTETCVAYNYRPTSSKYEVNCQLSNKTHQAIEISANGEWTFYQEVKPAVSFGRVPERQAEKGAGADLGYLKGGWLRKVFEKSAANKL